ncbi:MAG: DUF2149 domain-containing protein [Dissulfurimicrobium sp.]|uniref:DUF2149 domain-containing protein n=1 Tax=Dissulfurimicrobium TaxID=1769732 RepID=UPI003C794091
MYLRRRRFFKRILTVKDDPRDGDDDPLAGLVNLFDLSVVFIASLILTLFSVYRMQDLFSEKAEFTIMKQSKDGRLEIITKKGKKVTAMKVEKEKAEGRGERLGTAYRLEDGSLVYVPEQ